VEQAVARFTSNESGYDAAEIRSAWHELTAGAIDGNWVTGRPPRPIADWRSALTSELWKRRQIFSEKNPAPRAGARQSDGEPPDPLVVPQVTLKTMREAVE
jgi:hypothetical protein